MGAQDFYKLTKKQKQIVFEQVAEQKDLPLFVVEKDWWVVQTLDVIFQLDVAKYLLFKGGTSLSKAWHLIQRFSEDIDLALNREFFGFDSGIISKTQVKKLREKSFEFVTKTFFKSLQHAFKEKGFTELNFDFENLGDGDQDPVSILIYYPAITQHSEYVLPRIKVEIGSRSLREAVTNCSVVSFVGEAFPTRPFSDKSITIPCVNPERTYLEKLFLLHEEFKKPQKKMRVERLSRHLYDIAKIYHSEHKAKAYNKELICSIIEHRERFNAMRGVDYGTLYPPQLDSIPPPDFLKTWENDYKTMQNNMIPEISPNFTELLETVRMAINEYNTLKFQ